MPYREKRVWASLIILLTIASAYFFIVFNYWYFEPQGSAFINAIIQYITLNILINLFITSLAIFIILEFVVYLSYKGLTPSDVNTPKDERERLIEIKATRIAYTAFVLLEIIAAIIVVYYSSENPGGWSVSTWIIGNLVLFPIVIGQVTKYLVQIYYFRIES